MTGSRANGPLRGQLTDGGGFAELFPGAPERDFAGVDGHRLLPQISRRHWELQSRARADIRQSVGESYFVVAQPNRMRREQGRTQLGVLDLPQQVETAPAELEVAVMHSLPQCVGNRRPTSFELGVGQRAILKAGAAKLANQFSGGGGT